MSYNLPVALGKSANLDAFSRLRVSQPTTLFESKFMYDLQPLLFEAITTGTGAVSHNTTGRFATILAPANGDAAAMQSYQVARYQPGKSQLIFLTFNFLGKQTGATKYIGYSDGSNGFEFFVDDDGPAFRRFSDSGEGDLIVRRDSWNLDKISGLNLSKAQILVIDLQWLGVGLVRMGFDLDGRIIYAHEFDHANRVNVPYTQTADLPIRAGVVNTSANEPAAMYFICSSVSSEGGTESPYGYNFAQSGTVTAGNNTDTAILSVRPRTTFESQVNRTQFILDSVDVFNGGTNVIEWGLVLGAAFSAAPTWANVLTAYSAMEYTTAPGTMSSFTVGSILRGIVPAGTGGTRFSIRSSVRTLYPITLNAAGAQRANGTLTGIVRGIGGTSAGCRMVFNWTEVR